MAPGETTGHQPYLDALTKWATEPPHDVEIVPAKKEFFARTGEIFDDDKQFEMRMASFLEFYLFDRPLTSLGMTPARAYYLKALQEGPPERAAAFRAFTQTRHGVFEIRKLTPGNSRVRELVSMEEFDVTERRLVAGLEVGDVMEARLLPFGGQDYFSHAFGHHPRAAFELIRKEAKRRRKQGVDGGGKALAWDCAQRSLKADRYRNIAIDRIYVFGAQNLLPEKTPEKT
jgi:hypothetical protein